MKFLKKYIKIFIWIGLVVLFAGLYFFNPELFNIDRLQGLIAEHRVAAMVIYMILVSTLGIVFIPSTPFAIAAVYLFSPLEAFVMSMIGVLVSTIIVYYLSSFLGLDKIFNEKYEDKMKVVKAKLEQKDVWVIAGWSLLPFTVTDMIIYVASIMKIPLRRCLIGVLIGEGVLNFFYIFIATSII